MTDFRTRKDGRKYPVSGNSKTYRKEYEQPKEQKYKPETYKGLKIVFTPMRNGYIGASVPSRTSQYIGMGKSKKEAFEDAKSSIDNFKDVKEDYRIQKKGNKWNVLKNNKIILGGYKSQEKARQAKTRRKDQDKYSSS